MVDLRGAVEGLIDIGWIAWLGYWIGAPLYERSRGRYKAVAKRGRGSVLSLVLLAGAFGVLQILFTGALAILSMGPAPITPVDLLSGLLLVLLGLLLAVWSRAYLGTNWSPTAVLKRGQELVTSGPYAFVRNPIYLGITVAIIGTGLAYGGYRALVSIVLVLLFSWVRIREEERLMRDQFGPEFQSYRERVRAFIPRVL